MLTILMIDDDYGDSELIEKALANQVGPKDFVAVYGHDMGLFTLKTYTADHKDIPDVVIHEAAFSDGQGSDLTRFIKTSALLKEVPVLIYTNSDNDEAIKVCIAAGAKKVFSKSPGTTGPEALASYIATLFPKV